MASRNHYTNNYRRELLGKIESLNGHVFRRADLSQNLSNQGQLQLNRALKSFVDKGLIMKIAHGLYAKAMKMDFKGEGEKIVLRDSFENVAIEALDKLGLEWEFGQAIQAYNRGETTQIPIKFEVRLHSRYRGSIAAEGRQVIFEGRMNAR